MKVTRIMSTSNEAVKNAAALKQKKFRDEQGLFAVEGLKMLKEAVSANMKIKSVFVREDIYEEDSGFFNSLCADETHIVNVAVAEKLSDWKTPQGIVGVIEKPSYNLDEYLQKDNVFTIVLDEVADPGNIGTIIRTAEAAAVDAVITVAGTADCFQPKALRASMGSIFRIPVFENLEKCDIIYKLKSNSFFVAATSLKGEEISEDLTKKNKTAIVFGNEGSGISSDFERGADALVKLHMAGKAESLNVAVSAAIIMYMFNKQK